MTRGINEYEIGDLVVVDISFTDKAGVPGDPDVVAFIIKDGDGAIVTYTNGVDSEVTNPAVGNYLCEVDVTTWGAWHYYFSGTGSLQGAGEWKFNVKKSKVV